VSKIATFKLEIPCDDHVKAEAIKAIVHEAIRALGAKVMAAEAVDGKIIALIDTTAFFNAASVKTFVTRAEKPTNSAAGRSARPAA